MNSHYIRRWAIPGSIQHVYGHSVDGIALFHDDTDSAAFLTYLEKAVDKFDTKVLGFSLVANHYHLILKLGATPLDRVMQKLLASYAMHYNRRHGHRGYVFRSRYLSILVGDAWYEQCLQRYVIRNRFVAGLVDSVEALLLDPWTSLAGLLGLRAVRYLSVDVALSVFDKDPGLARQKLREFLDLSNDAPDPYLEKMDAARQGPEPWIVGPDEFIASCRRKFMEVNVGPSEAGPNTIDAVIREVCVRSGISEEALLLGRRDSDVVEARREIITIAFRELRLTFAEIGRALGISRSGVTRAFDGPRKKLGPAS